MVVRGSIMNLLTFRPFIYCQQDVGNRACGVFCSIQHGRACPKSHRAQTQHFDSIWPDLKVELNLNPDHWENLCLHVISGWIGCKKVVLRKKCPNWVNCHQFYYTRKCPTQHELPDCSLWPGQKCHFASNLQNSVMFSYPSLQLVLFLLHTGCNVWFSL